MFEEYESNRVCLLNGNRVVFVNVAPGRSRAKVIMEIIRGVEIGKRVSIEAICRINDSVMICPRSVKAFRCEKP